MKKMESKLVTVTNHSHQAADSANGISAPRRANPALTASSIARLATGLRASMNQALPADKRPATAGEARAVAVFGKLDSMSSIMFRMILLGMLMEYLPGSGILQ
jgi:hypothetical protein